jgi:hypothetical protein
MSECGHAEIAFGGIKPLQIQASNFFRRNFHGRARQMK